LDIIASLPDRSIRPARLAAELGLSVEDASAELCGLLAAVGGGHDGASFRFETSTAVGAAATTTTTMVFDFPPDFAQRARRHRTQQNMWHAAQQAGLVAVKIIKVVTAFGLILSLLIVSVAAMMAMLAALVALSRGDGGGHRQRNALLGQVRLVFYSVRQMLWCYALFGPTGGDEDGASAGGGGGGQDPFLREVAYDMALLCSVCCGNPGSIFYWMRMNQLQRRRHRMFRGWGGRSSTATTSDSGGMMESDVPGVTLHRRDGTTIISSAGEHRGLLSVAVEFLFGPSPFAPSPTEEEKWVLRSAALMQLSTKSAGSGVALEAMAPYVDSPPESPEDDSRIVEQTLLIVSHFNGLPSKQLSAEENQNAEKRKARFIFPELMAESAVATRYEHAEVVDDMTWQSLLYTKSEERTPRRTNTIPSWMKEERYRFTQITSKQFLHCLFLGSLNFIGVFWLRQSVAPGGVIYLAPGTPGASLVLKGLIPVLWFYARLFFALPAVRLLLIVGLNRLRIKRNKRRANLVVRTLGSS